LSVIMQSNDGGVPERHRSYSFKVAVVAAGDWGGWRHFI